MPRVLTAAKLADRIVQQLRVGGMMNVTFHRCGIDSDLLPFSNPSPAAQRISTQLIFSQLEARIRLMLSCRQLLHGVGQSLFRVPVPGQSIHAVQPDAGYYTLRTQATVLDEWTGSEFPVSFSGDKGFEVFTLRCGESELMVAAWLPGDTTDGLVESKSDVTLPMPDVERAWVVDVLNGTEQELTSSNDGQRTVFEGILIKDYPTLIRVKRRLP